MDITHVDKRKVGYRGDEEEVIKGNWVGIEDPYVWDGVLFWFDPKTKTAHPRLGFEKMFKEYFKKVKVNK
jgi:hypothetical protein